MNYFYLSLTAVLCLFCLPAWAETGTTAKGPADVEQKFLGDWKGKAACQGDLSLTADGTFVRTDCGPGGIRYAGTWKLTWDALPPTLVLSCETSDDADRVGRKEEMKVQQLDDKLLTVTYPGKDFRWQFERKVK
jgi:hypothetical protein